MAEKTWSEVMEMVEFPCNKCFTLACGVSGCVDRINWIAKRKAQTRENLNRLKIEMKELMRAAIEDANPSRKE